MKKMNWRTFERKLKDGYIEVNAWLGESASIVDVIIYNAAGDSRREAIELTGKPSKEWLAA